MTQEEKKILIRDLCARLPYSVKAFIKYTDESVKPQLITGISKEYVTLYDEECQYEEEFPFDSIQPYLRPMSSMTEEEDKDWQFYKNRIAESCDELLNERITELHDWFHRKHFDYRGLISKGLALEAPKGMYNIKEK